MVFIVYLKGFEESWSFKRKK